MEVVKGHFNCLNQIKVRFVDLECQSLLLGEVQQVLDQCVEHHGTVSAVFNDRL